MKFIRKQSGLLFVRLAAVKSDPPNSTVDCWILFIELNSRLLNSIYRKNINFRLFKKCFDIFICLSFPVLNIENSKSRQLLNCNKFASHFFHQIHSFPLAKEPTSNLSRLDCLRWVAKIMRRGKWTFGVGGGGGGVLGYIKRALYQTVALHNHFTIHLHVLIFSAIFLPLCSSGAPSLESVRTNWEYRIDRLKVQLVRRPLWKLFLSASEFLPSRVHFPIPNHL